MMRVNAVAVVLFAAGLREASSQLNTHCSDKERCPHGQCCTSGAHGPSYCADALSCPEELRPQECPCADVDDCIEATGDRDACSKIYGVGQASAMAINGTVHV